MEPLLEVLHLKKYFHAGYGTLHAVDGVSFRIPKGSTLGLVGESGCGKTTTGRSILRLIEPTAGEVMFKGRNILHASPGELRALRAEMQIIFQDPYSSLNPRMTVSQIIGEPLWIHHRVRDRRVLERKVRELMDKVELAGRLYGAYPHELDGGRRQRIGIARALSLHPQFILCDEPVSALDVSVQAQILNLLKDLQEELGLTYLFITHDMSVVKHMSDTIAVMYLGQIVEMAPAEALFGKQLHPYTQALISAIPPLEPGSWQDEGTLKGELSSPIDPAPGCRFAPRCPLAMEKCLGHDPPLMESAPGRFSSCIRAQEMI